ncbi:phage tail assembly chaperone [Paenibacillus tyrfis]|uniref:phage tail assembly chaperone n=1 Tax=Paenibacillus tyrfis TaxID=1501230 RepID=UPI000B587573|nr:XkdN-like protein [Paenibacillus tyrfis]
MSTLDLLLAIDPETLNRPTKQVEIKRLSELVGQPVVFTVQAITFDEMNEIQDITAGKGTDGSKMVPLFTVLKGVVEPSLKDSTLLGRFNVSTPKELLDSGKLLLPGEVMELYEQISGLSGFGEGKVVELKNA